MKKSLVLALVAVLVLSFASMAFAFTDTTSHWANPYINKLVDVKVVNGATATTFVPDGKVTRAEFAKMIVNAKGLALENPATATFSDVAVTAWYFPYIEAAAKAGLVSGTGNGKFAPTANVTRQEVAKMIVLAAGLKADDTKALNFDDKASISDWAKGFVAVAADAKLVQGYNNKFSPVANATRAEAAKLVYSEMLYEGKITAVAEVLPVGTYKVTDTPSTWNASSIELNDKDYDISNVTMKIDGEYVDDLRFFPDGTLVSVTFRNDKVVAIEAKGTSVTGEITETGKNADDDDTVTINGKDYVIDGDFASLKVDSTDSSDDTVTLANVQNASIVGDNYKLFLNADGDVFAIMGVDATTKTGLVNGKGKTSDDKYFITIDSTKYYTEKDVTNVDSVVTVKVDGAVSNWVGIKAGDMVAEVTLNNAGELTKVTAYTEKLESTVSTYIYDDNAATKKYVAYGSDKYTNIRLVDGYYVGEKVVVVTGFGVGTLALTDTNFRPINDSIDIKIGGVNKEWQDVDDSDRVKLIVNTDGEVTSGQVIDGGATGQVEAFTENSDGEVTKVKIGGVEYTLADALPNDDDLIYKGALVDASLNDANEVEIEASNGSIFNFKENSDDEIITYTVIATPFTKGNYIANLPNEDSYSAGGTIRIMDEDGNKYIVKTSVDYVKSADTVKIGTVKIGDTVALSSEGTLNIAATDASTPDLFKYIVISPLAK